MIAKRSPSGLQNMRLFKKVDLVIYTEGGDGSTLSKEDVLKGKGHEASDDVYFWQKIFEIFRPNTSIKILAVGSSETLKEIARDIEKEQLNGVCVAMDKDYRQFWGNQTSHRNVIISRTYSWENEFFNFEIILSAYRRAAIGSFDPDEIREILKASEQSILRSLRPFFFADLVLVAANNSFFCRSKPGFCFQNSNCNSLPQVDQPRMYTVLRKKRPKHLVFASSGDLTIGMSLETFSESLFSSQH